MSEEKEVTEQTTTHTPGPWVVNPIGEIQTEDGFCTIGLPSRNWMVTEKESWLNAHLMAAAPDLLVAIKLILDVRFGSFEDGWTICITGHQMNKIADAYEKAKGGAS